MRRKLRWTFGNSGISIEPVSARERYPSSPSILPDVASFHVASHTFVLAVTPPPHFRMDPPLNQRAGILGAAARIYQRTYLADYIGFLLLQGAYQLTLILITPNHRQFALDSRAIQHPHAHSERVSSWQ